MNALDQYRSDLDQSIIRLGETLHANAGLFQSAGDYIRVIRSTLATVPQLPQTMQEVASEVRAAIIAPRTGDEFTMIQDRDNPFRPNHVIRVLGIKGDWVSYVFVHLGAFGMESPSSCKIDAFIAVYYPTLETIMAQEKGMTLPEFRAWEADEKQTQIDAVQDAEDAERERMGAVFRRTAEDAALEAGK